MHADLLVSSSRVLGLRAWATVTGSFFLNMDEHLYSEPDLTDEGSSKSLLLSMSPHTN